MVWTSICTLASNVRGGLDLLTQHMIHLMVVFTLIICQHPSPKLVLLQHRFLSVLFMDVHMNGWHKVRTL